MKIYKGVIFRNTMAKEELGLLSKIGFTVIGTSIFWLPFVAAALEPAVDRRLVWINREGNKPLAHNYPGHAGQDPYFVAKQIDGKETTITPYEHGTHIIDNHSDGTVDTKSILIFAGRRGGFIHTEKGSSADQALYDKALVQYDTAELMTGMFKPNLWNRNR